MLTQIIIFGLLIQTAAPPTSEPASEPDWISPPAETVEIRDFPITLAAGDVRAWVGGNRLVIDAEDRVQLLPGSYVPDSLVLKGTAGEKFESPRDYIVDDTWGAFAITSSGQLKAEQQVHATYRYSLRRVDAVVVDEEGRIRVIQGEPSADCPLLPAIPENAHHLANIYRPFNAGTVRPEHIYRIKPTPIDLSPLKPSTRLQEVIQKLQNGGPVTVVCWGDSVTVGVDSGPPGTNYVSRFEAMLKERYPKANLKVINAGISGSDIRTRLPDVQKDVFDHHPDLITIEFVNDMGLPVKEMSERYGQLMEKVRAAKVALIVMTPHFNMPGWMPEMPNGHGRDRRAGVAFWRQYTKSLGIPLADASRRWEQLEDLGVPYEIYLRNGINHPDERGHQIYAEELMRYFAP